MGRKRVDLSSGTKRCPHCKETKPVSEFHKSDATLHGLQVYCKPCGVLRHRKWRVKNLGWAAEQARKWRAANPERSRDHLLKSHYGVPIGTYDTMLAAQNGKCAMCGSDSSGNKTGRFHMDHCHDTKKIRGLLCHHCNIGLGCFFHSVARLEAAIRYLAESGAESGG